jgi:hypothetical protein
LGVRRIGAIHALIDDAVTIVVNAVARLRDRILVAHALDGVAPHTLPRAGRTAPQLPGVAGDAGLKAGSATGDAGWDAHAALLRIAEAAGGAEPVIRGVGAGPTDLLALVDGAGHAVVAG